MDKLLDEYKARKWSTKDKAIEIEKVSQKIDAIKGSIELHSRLFDEASTEPYKQAIQRTLDGLVYEANEWEQVKAYLKSS